MKFPVSLKLAVVTGLTCFASLHATAQKTYVKLGGGYNFGLRSTSYFQSTENGNYLGSGFSKDYVQFKNVNVNLGNGGIFGGTFGYMFNNNIGVEVGVNYLAGTESKSKIEEHIGSLGFGNINSPLQGVSPMSSATETFTTKSQMVFVQPSMVIAAGLPKFNPYIRMGLVIAKGNLENSYSFSNSSRESIEAEDTYYGGLGFGLQGALGLDFKLNDNFRIYTESIFNNVAYVPEKGELSSYTRNGTDMMPTFNTSQKEINFEDKQTVSSNDQQDPSSPSTGPKQRYSLNSVGLNVGMKFSF